MLQADFFGLPGLADKASTGLEADPSHRQREAGGASHAAPAGCQYDSVYLETGFHPVKSEFNALQQQQAATMEVILSSLCMLLSPSETYQGMQGCSCPGDSRIVLHTGYPVYSVSSIMQGMAGKQAHSH